MEKWLKLPQNSLGEFSLILQTKSNIYIGDCVFIYCLLFFLVYYEKNLNLMDELSVLSISLSIASIGIFFLFFASNDDDDQDGGKLIKSVQRIN